MKAENKTVSATLVLSTTFCPLPGKTLRNWRLRELCQQSDQRWGKIFKQRSTADKIKILKLQLRSTRKWDSWEWMENTHKEFRLIDTEILWDLFPCGLQLPVYSFYKRPSVSLLQQPLLCLTSPCTHIRLLKGLLSKNSPSGMQATA